MYIEANIWILAFFLFVFSFGKQVSILKLRVAPMFDTYFHMYLIDLCRSYKCEYPKFYQRFSINKRKVLYPFFFHRLLAFIPRCADGFIMHYFNAFIDSIVAAFIFLCFYFFGFDVWVSLSLSLVYVLTPSVFSVFGAGPRLSSFTPRLLGELFFNLLVVCLIVYIETGNELVLVVSVAFGSAIMAGNQFSRQGLVILIPLAMFYEDLMLVGVFVLSFFGGWLLFGWNFYDSILHKYNHYKWYLLQIRNGGLRSGDRSFIKGLVVAWRNKSIGMLDSQMNDLNPFLIVLFKMPFVIVSMVCGFYDFYHGVVSVYSFSAFVILLFMFSIYVITSLKWFLFLGESERYLNHVFVCALIVLSAHEEVLLFLMLYGLCFFAFECAKSTYFSRKNNSVVSRLPESLVRYLDDSDKRVISFPITLVGWEVLYKSKCTVVTPSDVIFSYEDSGVFESYKNVASDKIADAVEYFDINIIVSITPLDHQLSENGLSYNVESINGYYVYEIK